MALTIHTDGGSRGNPGPAASAFIIEDSARRLVYSQGHFLGRTTNNQAEYQAVLFSLHWLISHPQSDTQINFFLDSLLVVNQLSGLYKIKDPGLISLAAQIKKILNQHQFSAVFFYIPRAQNSAADLLVNQTLDSSLSS